MNGMTVEVTNTDAEGRLILADAMTWAEREGATHIVDVATLTGAQAMAFGDQISAYFARPRDWGDRVAAAAERAGEWFWEMPLALEYRASYDSPHADIVNSGSREGSLIKSAVFLSEFVTVPWVHCRHRRAPPTSARRSPTGRRARPVRRSARSLSLRSASAQRTRREPRSPARGGQGSRSV